jgi:hypothetical protein
LTTPLDKPTLPSEELSKKWNSSLKNVKAMHKTQNTIRFKKVFNKMKLILLDKV